MVIFLLIDLHFCNVVKSYVEISFRMCQHSFKPALWGWNKKYWEGSDESNTASHYCQRPTIYRKIKSFAIAYTKILQIRGDMTEVYITLIGKYDSNINLLLFFKDDYSAGGNSL